MLTDSYDKKVFLDVPLFLVLQAHISTALADHLLQLPLWSKVTAVFRLKLNSLIANSSALCSPLVTKWCSTDTNQRIPHHVPESTFHFCSLLSTPPSHL